MKSKRVFGIFITVIMIATLMGGCTGGTASPAASPEPAGTPEISEPTPDPTAQPPITNTVTDELGREVAIPENPEKILALTSSVMEGLFNNGLTLIGKVDEYKVRQEGIDLPSVGATSSVNIEAIYALEPDLIIASSRFHSAIKEELERSGAVIYFFDPDKVGEVPVVDMAVYLGKLLRTENTAQAYVASINELAEGLKAQIAAADIKTGVFIQDGDTITAAQSASGYGSMFTLLGIENIVPDDLPGSSKSSWVAFDIETILANNPDIVIIQTSSKDADNEQILQKYLNDAQWSSLDAAQNGRIVILPFAVNPNRSTAEKMLQMTAKTILSAAEGQ